MSDDLTARIERLESVEEIRQLVAKYCLALDVRDADSWVNLFPADVRVGRDETGRRALKRWFDSTMRDQFEGTAHVTGNHIIELIDGDHARGVVYSRNEHECGNEWVIMTMMYWDDYERIDRRWYFRRRLPLYWYATDLNKPPTGRHKMRWPGREPYEGEWETFWPTYQEFWAQRLEEPVDVAAAAPLGEFLTHVRRGRADVPNIRVR